ncbi:hypothetical protein ABT173_16875 [Streptomyces sp. NPDC001795]
MNDGAGAFKNAVAAECLAVLCAEPLPPAFGRGSGRRGLAAGP